MTSPTDEPIDESRRLPVGRSSRRAILDDGSSREEKDGLTFPETPDKMASSIP
jgi:hypothetical protein